MTTFAGHNGGAVDGPGDVALFSTAFDVATDRHGNVYVADYGNFTIRRISPSGMVTTLAGLAHVIGTTDGRGSAARFNNLPGLAADDSGNLYAADSVNHTIRKITPGGVVTTLAGFPGATGSADGTGADARFQQPADIAADGHGNVYVSDYNHTIRKITAAGVVTTLAGLANVSGSADGNGSAARFYFPEGIAVDDDGNVYVVDSANHTIRRITPNGDVTTFAGAAGAPGDANGSRTEARFYYPDRIALDDSGNLYVSESGVHTIRKIAPDGAVTAFAGLSFAGGHVDAVGTNARFDLPRGMATDSAGNLYVGDSGTVRKITPDASVSTVAGRPGGYGFADGTGSAARFWSPAGVVVDGSGNVFVSDLLNNRIRRITPAGEVTTFAGAQAFGTADGVGSAARFRRPQNMAIDGAGSIYVADTDNSTIRMISPAGAVTTVAGLGATPGSTDANGASARFNLPRGVAVFGQIVYVADTANHTIRKITAAGDVTTLAGSALQPGAVNGSGSAARFNEPKAITTDASGNIYVADRQNDAIRKITPAGNVTTFAGLLGANGSSDGIGSQARFNGPSGITTDSAGNLYVTDSASSIRKITPSASVTTIAGVYGKLGTDDGTGSFARFSFPVGLAVGSDGLMYIADGANDLIRKGAPALPDVAIIDLDDGALLVPRQLDTSPQTATEWSWSIIRRPAGSVNDLSAANTRNPTFAPDAPGLYTFRLVATDGSVSSITTVDLTVAPQPPVDLGAPVNFLATANGAAQVALTWTEVAGATHYEIFRRSDGGPFVLLESCPDAVACTDIAVAPNTTYFYKVRAMDDDGPSTFSESDPATTTAFTNHPLTAGTSARAAHILELRTAVNAMRSAAGLPAATFATEVAAGAWIRASAIEELRSAVDEARSTLGMAPFPYDDPTLTPEVTPIKAIHIAQLREAVQ